MAEANWRRSRGGCACRRRIACGVVRQLCLSLKSQGHDALEETVTRPHLRPTINGGRSRALHTSFEFRRSRARLERRKASQFPSDWRRANKLGITDPRGRRRHSHNRTRPAGLRPPIRCRFKANARRQIVQARRYLNYRDDRLTGFGSILASAASLRRQKIPATRERSP